MWGGEVQQHWAAYQNSVKLLCTFALLLTIAACGAGPSMEVTSEKPYSELIGRRYAVVTDQLCAYGVFESLKERKVSWVTLVPTNIAGPEVAFRRRIPKGQVIKLLSAYRHFVLFESGVYYVVELQMGSRHGSLVTTGFLYDGLNPVQELAGSLPSANLLTGLGVDEYLMRTDAAGARSFLTDALGSTWPLADSANVVSFTSCSVCLRALRDYSSLP